MHSRGGWLSDRALRPCGYEVRYLPFKKTDMSPCIRTAAGSMNRPLGYEIRKCSVKKSSTPLHMFDLLAGRLSGFLGHEFHLFLEAINAFHIRAVCLA